jgi:hypothetical protein
MVTAAQVKRMVKPLLARHSDLALVGRSIYVKPVHHVARLVHIGATSSAEDFEPRWEVIHLFEVRRSSASSWGGDIYDRRQGHWWSARNDPNVADTLVTAIEQQALPWLRTISTLDLFFGFVSQNYFRHHLYDRPEVAIVVWIAFGYLKAARTIAEKYLERWSTDDPQYDDDVRAEYGRLRELCALLKADDRAGLARLLHEWEALTVKNFKIEHLWEPTPFPLETIPSA